MIDPKLRAIYYLTLRDGRWGGDSEAAHMMAVAKCSQATKSAKNCNVAIWNDERTYENVRPQ